MVRKKASRQEQSQRQLRVGEEIRRVLAEALERGTFYDSCLESFRVIISEVRISADFSIAKVFIAPLGGEGLSELLAELRKNKGYFRKVLGMKLRLRITPDIVFLGDQSFEEAQHINELLQRPEVQRDIRSGDSEDDGNR